MTLPVPDEVAMSTCLSISQAQWTLLPSSVQLRGPRDGCDAVVSPGFSPLWCVLTTLEALPVIPLAKSLYLSPFGVSLIITRILMGTYSFVCDTICELFYYCVIFFDASYIDLS